MPDSFKEFFAGMNYWKLAIAKLFNKCLASAIGTFLTSVKGLDWHALSAFDRVCVVLGCILTIATIIDAFLDNTISQLRAAKGDTTFIEKLKGP